MWVPDSNWLKILPGRHWQGTISTTSSDWPTWLGSRLPGGVRIFYTIKKCMNPTYAALY